MPTTADRPPRQSRSRKTFGLLLDAAERLLREKPWESISIADITREAGCSNGAVYGRFSRKDDLLVALYRRHDARLNQRYAPETQSEPRPGESLRQLLEREIRELIRRIREDRWLLRAMGLLSRIKPEVVSPAMRADRQAIFEQIADRFTPFAPAAEPADFPRRVQIAVFFVSTLARECILHPGPHADAVGLSDEELHRSLVEMALGLVGGAGEPAGTGRGERRDAQEEQEEAQ